jgi:hypothetical protein
MDAAALTAYLETEWAEVIAEASIDPARIVGIVAEAYLADPALSDGWAEPLGDYYLLRRAARAFAVDFDVTLGDNSYRLSQRKTIDKLLANAYGHVAWIVDPEGGDAGGLVTISKDFWMHTGEAAS